MSIYYALVARGPIILVDFTEHHGNFEQITTKILQSMDLSQDSKCSYTSESYVFHVMINQGLVFLCMADDSMGKTIPYGYLTEVKNKFMGGTLRERAFHCNAYELKHDFRPVLMQQMKRFNSGDVDLEANSKVRNLQKNVDEVKSVMTENIGKLLERGEKLDVLVDKTEDLSKSSESFARSAKRVRRKMWWQNKKMCLILSCILFVILAIITMIILYEVGVFSASKSSTGGGGKTTSIPTTLKPTTTTTTTTTQIVTTIKTTLKTTATTPAKNVTTVLPPTSSTTILPPTNSTTTPSKV